MDFFRRVQDRLSWIMGTVQLGADVLSQTKLLLGGLWFFINDSWKTSLKVNARIEQFGRSRPFLFEDLGDFGLFCEIFQSDAYDCSLPHNVQTIFDLGANTGVSALYFRLRYPDATIHCFEPDPENVRRLRHHAEILGDVHVHEVAVWSLDGTLTFHADPHRGSISSAYSVHDRQHKIEVEAQTLASALSTTGVDAVDLLKFDVEGAEEAILTSFHDFGRVRALCGEVHGDLCEGETVLDLIRARFDRVDVVPTEIDNRWYVVAHQ